MKKFLLNAFATGALLSIGIASQAQSFIFEALDFTTTPAGTGAFTSLSGISPTSGSDLTITTSFASLGPQTYSVVSPGSVLQYGTNNVSAGTATNGTSATFSAVPVTFDFQVDAGTAFTAGTHTFRAMGVIDGTVGYNSGGSEFSTANIVYSSITDLTTGTTSVLTADPNNTLPAVLIFVPNLDGNSVALYLDQKQSLPIPGGSFVNQGFIAATPVNFTPEPGAIAMLVGMGVSGSTFLLRKRRRA